MSELFLKSKLKKRVKKSDSIENDSSVRSSTSYIDRLAVRPSKVNGRGVFAVKRLPSRRKLGELSGKLVRLPEGRKQIEGKSKIYFVELTTRMALDCRRGNLFRFLNHSCESNAYLRIIGHRVEVYSKRGVSVGEELTVDYGVTPHKGGMKCNCGSSKCRTRC